jgi:hypothetical protein
MGSSMSSIARDSYQLRQLSGESGNLIREYVNHSGTVFAITWSGPAPPDLKQLLGAHYLAYTSALARLNHPGLQRSIRIASTELVVEATGRPRAFRGRAYLPGALPSRVSPTELH